MHRFNQMVIMVSSSFLPSFLSFFLSFLLSKFAVSIRFAATSSYIILYCPYELVYFWSYTAIISTQFSQSIWVVVSHLITSVHSSLLFYPIVTITSPKCIFNSVNNAMHETCVHEMDDKAWTNEFLMCQSEDALMELLGSRRCNLSVSHWDIIVKLTEFWT